MWPRLKPITSFDSSGPLERAYRGKGCGGVAAGEGSWSLGSLGCAGQALREAWRESRSKYIADEAVHFLLQECELGGAAELCGLGLVGDDSSFCLHLLPWFILHASQVWKSWILKEELPGVRRPLLHPSSLSFCQPHMLHGWRGSYFQPTALRWSLYASSS